MKELDFDELDKAVNSLMTSVPGASPSAPDESSTAVTVPESTNDSPAAPNPVASVVKTVPATSVPSPVTPQRRSGRFMDVVHPSSDMRAAPSTVIPSRQGVSIMPPTDTNARSTTTANPAALAPAATITPPPSTELNETWPDPVTFGSDTPGLKNPLETITTTPTEPKITPEVQTPTQPSSSDPLEPAFSPFITDAKVEKRPLGSAAPTGATDEIKDDITATDLPGDPTPEPLSPELTGDVLSIEADAGHTDEPKPPVAIDLSAETSPEPEATMKIPGATSITQQYKEQPSSGDQTHPAMYDTVSQPLAHPAKKKSGWIWVLWIVLLLAIGAGAAAALYYYKII